MGFSVNTNSGAMIALQNLNKTQRSMDGVQSRINTGLKVAGSKDDSATFAVAQKLRGDLSGLKAVQGSLSRAKSTVDVALSGAETVSDILVQMKGKAMAASDDGIDTATRDALNEDFIALRDQITSVVNASTFNGTNLLDGGTGTVAALKSIQDGDSVTADWQGDTLDVANQDLALGAGAAGTNVVLADNQDINTQAEAETAVQDIDDSIANVNTVLSSLGSAARLIDSQGELMSKLTDSIETGVGNLVDADLAKESANLQALQVKQQLGVQALSIANQAPQTILSLFR